MRKRSVLICHDEDRLNRLALAQWMGSFSDVAGIVSIRETADRKKRRIRREFERSGVVRFADMLAFRVYYKLFLAAADRQWEEDTIERVTRTYPPLPATTETLITPNPNSPEAESFIRKCAPDFTIARCKTLLAKRIFTIPAAGTYVMHPGICPEYRNSHGCFWALAQGDRSNVGMTLLKIDAGIDTGPVYGYFRVNADDRESHIVIQHRTVFDNLNAIRDRFEQILAGTAERIDTTGRRSAEWGQPWLTSYLKWKRSNRPATAAA